MSFRSFCVKQVQSLPPGSPTSCVSVDVAASVPRGGTVPSGATVPRGGTVLVADSHRDDLQLLQQTLTSNGYHCLPCSTWSEAIAAAQANELHHVVCGAEWDGESGIALYGQILKVKQSFVPAVFISSTQTADIIHRCVADCGSYFLRRPWSANVLVTLLERLRANQSER